MVEKLQKLLENSYCPYSKFKVAAVVVTKDGKEFAGVNVENASFGATICAERSAIVNAVSNGYRKNDFASLFIMCDDDKCMSVYKILFQACLGVLISFKLCNVTV